jgi:hypothetical protein
MGIIVSRHTDLSWEIPGPRADVALGEQGPAELESWAWWSGADFQGDEAPDGEPHGGYPATRWTYKTVSGSSSESASPRT